MWDAPALASVVIVDDDEDLRQSLAEVLVWIGARRCITAASLAEVESRAADVLASDLAVLDVNLGVGEPSGLDVLRWLRERGYAGRIVFLTGHARSHPLVKGAAAEDVRVLEKPVGTAELARLLAAP
jgi:DNA-binding response OmpR family regulator